MPNIYDVALGFRQQLLRQEAGAAREIVARYGMIYLRLKSELQDFLQKVEAEKNVGVGGFKIGWVFREDRLQTLIDQVEAEINRFSSYLATRVSDQQRDAVESAQNNAETAIASAQPPGASTEFNRLPQEALSDLVGFLQDGSPLKSLLDKLGPDAAESVKSSLLAGLAAGRNPRSIAREIRASMGMTLTRALTISRTETLRAYRTATLRNYQANSDVVAQWVWVAAQDERTCAVCLAMDGQRFDTDVMMGTHPNCRCCLAPVTKSWSDLGYKGIEEQTERPNGEEWLKKQDAATQTKALGIAKREAWLNGEINLSDIVRYRDNPQWGPTRTEASLQEAITKSQGPV